MPEELALAIRRAFHEPARMALRHGLRERKFVTAQMNRFDPLLEEALFAFQDPRVVRAVAAITGSDALEPDAELYAGGISVMGRGYCLSPNFDNSHDRERRRYRALNLLYYVSPVWKAENGGKLELWPDGARGTPLPLYSLFNRLVVMMNTRSSWHSVSTVAVDELRCCVSNYYFSERSPEGAEYFHPISFRGGAGEPLRDFVLRADSMLRMAVRHVAKRGLARTWHYYRKDDA